MHPYEGFLAEQKEREVDWASKRVAKRMKPGETESNTGSSHTEKDKLEVESIRQQLNARTEEGVALKDQLQDLQQANADVLKWQQSMQENLCKVRRMISMICICSCYD